MLWITQNVEYLDFAPMLNAQNPLDLSPSVKLTSIVSMRLSFYFYFLLCL